MMFARDHSEQPFNPPPEMPVHNTIDPKVQMKADYKQNLVHTVDNSICLERENAPVRMGQKQRD